MRDDIGGGGSMYLFLGGVVEGIDQTIIVPLRASIVT